MPQYLFQNFDRISAQTLQTFRTLNITTISTLPLHPFSSTITRKPSVFNLTGIPSLHHSIKSNPLALAYCRSWLIRAQSKTWAGSTVPPSSLHLCRCGLQYSYRSISSVHETQCSHGWQSGDELQGTRGRTQHGGTKYGWTDVEDPTRWKTVQSRFLLQHTMREHLRYRWDCSQWGASNTCLLVVHFTIPSVYMADHRDRAV
jgi:hypothetical protein